MKATGVLLNSIRIGPITYTVVEKDDLHYCDTEGKKHFLFGRISWGNAQIEVDNDQVRDRKVVTLFHEALHGILENAGIDEQPENIIQALGFGIVQLIRDNPELVQLAMHPQVAVGGEGNDDRRNDEC